jgi:pseudouridine kinase
MEVVGNKDNIFANAQNHSKGVVVIGGANIDVKGKTFEKLKEFTSNPGKVAKAVGGVGRNIAHNLALLGVPIVFLSAIGNDEWGRKILEETGGAGVDIGAVKISKINPTGIYMAILNETGEMMMAVSDMKVCDEINMSYLKSNENIIRKSHVIVMDTNLPERSIRYISKICVDEGIKLVVEPVSVEKSMKLKRVLDRIDYITPNKEEMEALIGVNCLKYKEDIIREVKSFRKRNKKIKNIVLTLGEKGVFFSEKAVNKKQNERDDRFADQFIPPYKVEVIEVTGTGDAFVAGFVYGIYLNVAFKKSVKYGLAAAALTISTPFTVNPGMNEKLLKILVEKSE